MIVGIYSSVPQSGKTTLAHHVLARVPQARRVKFAGPLKAMLRAALESAGWSPEMTWAALEGDLKETPLKELAGRTPRYAMQTLGTEWGRRLLGPDVWVNLAMARARSLSSGGHLVLMDDMRFVNELQAVRAAGGLTVRVVRPGLERAMEYAGHSSEGALDGFDFDLTLENHYTTADVWGVNGSLSIMDALGRSRGWYR